MKARRAYTLVELSVVIAIILTLAGLLAGVVTGTKRAAIATRSISDQRQIFLAASIYRSDNDGEGVFGSVVSMGLPLANSDNWTPWHERFSTSRDLWKGCGPHPTYPGTHSITYFFNWVDFPYEQWTQKWGDRTPLTYDMTCTPTERHIYNSKETRFGLAVNLGGSAVRRWSTGDPNKIEFWFDDE